MGGFLGGDRVFVHQSLHDFLGADVQVADAGRVGGAYDDAFMVIDNHRKAGPGPNHFHQMFGHFPELIWKPHGHASLKGGCRDNAGSRIGAIAFH